MKKRGLGPVGCLLALPILVGLVFIGGCISMFVPHEVADRDAASWFRRLVCEPMPASVTNLTASGRTMFTGKYVRLGFLASPTDLNVMVKVGDFVPWDGRTGDSSGITNLCRGLINPQVFLKHNTNFNFENARLVTLVFETNRGAARVEYFRP